MELYMMQYCWFSIMFLSDMREDAYQFICKKYSYARYKLMNRLLSFKNDLVIVDTHLLLWGVNVLYCAVTYFR